MGLEAVIGSMEGRKARVVHIKSYRRMAVDNVLEIGVE